MNNLDFISHWFNRPVDDIAMLPVRVIQKMVDAIEASDFMALHMMGYDIDYILKGGDYET